MVCTGLFEESFDAKNGVVKVVELRPSDVDVQSGKMVLDGSADTLGKSINVLKAVHVEEASRYSFARLMRPVCFGTGRYNAKRPEQPAGHVLYTSRDAR